MTFKNIIKKQFFFAGKATRGVSTRFFPNTDVGNAERFANQHGNHLKYIHSEKKWYTFDGICWAEDLTNEVQRLAKLTAREISKEAARCEDENKRAALKKWALQAESASRINAMIQLAQSEPDIQWTADGFNPNPYLLNARNGTIDLRTGKLREHNAADALTDSTTCNMASSADCPRWQGLLGKIYRSDPQMISFIQRLFGQGLLALPFDKLPIHYGAGANGKSTIFQTLAAILGTTMFRTAAKSLLTVNKYDNLDEATCSVRHARIVMCSESSIDSKLNEESVKLLTGGDRLTARNLYSTRIEFNPTHQLHLLTNHKPEIRGADYAIWRRVLLVPYRFTIPPEDRVENFHLTLQDEHPAILRWLVEGCVEYLRIGLQPPSDVLAATNEYEQESDDFARFLDQEYEPVADAKVAYADMLDKWNDWKRHTLNHWGPDDSRKAFSGRLDAKAIERRRIGKDNTFYVLGFNPRTADVDDFDLFEEAQT